MSSADKLSDESDAAYYARLNSLAAGLCGFTKSEDGRWWMNNESGGVYVVAERWDDDHDSWLHHTAWHPTRDIAQAWLVQEVAIAANDLVFTEALLNQNEWCGNMRRDVWLANATPLARVISAIRATEKK